MIPRFESSCSFMMPISFFVPLTHSILCISSSFYLLNELSFLGFCSYLIWCFTNVSTLCKMMLVLDYHQTVLIALS